MHARRVVAPLILLLLVTCCGVTKAQERRESVAALKAQLSDPDAMVRRRAAWDLGKLGTDAAPAAEALAGLLQDRSVRVRATALVALESMGEAAAPAIPELTAVAREGKEDAPTAVRILGGIGPDATPALIEIARDNRKLGGAAAYWVLQSREDGIDLLLRQARAPGDPPRLPSHLWRAIGRAGDAAVDALTVLLDNPSADERAMAVELLAYMGEPAARIAPLLVDALGDESSDVRVAAASGLRGLDDIATGAVAVLKRLVDDPSIEVVLAAVRTLGETIKRHGSAEIVATFLSHADPSVRAAAAEAVGKGGPSAAPIASRLAELLADDNASVRGAAARALAGLKDVAATEPVIRELLAHESVGVRITAAGALCSIGLPEAAVAELAGHLESEDPDVRLQALGALRPCGDATAPVADRLLRFVQEGSPEESWSALQVLIEAEDDRVAPMLVPLLASQDVRSRDFAAQGLQRLGHPAVVLVLLDQMGSFTWDDFKVGAGAALFTMGEKAIPGLLQVLREGTPERRVKAARVLNTLGPRAETSPVPGLIGCLGSGDEELRLAAVEALGFGAPAVGGIPGAEEAVPELLPLLADPSPRVRAAVALVLVYMGHPDPARPVLLAMATAPPPEAAYRTGVALSRIDETEAAVRALTAILESDESEDSPKAARRLTELGPAAAAAVPVLIEMATRVLRSSPDRPAPPGLSGSYEAIRALGAIGTTEAAEVLARIMIEHERYQYRRAAAWALVDLGRIRYARPNRSMTLYDQPPMALLPGFVEALCDENEEVRQAAAVALGQFGAGGRDAVPALEDTLDDVSEDVRDVAQRALALIRPD